MSNQAAGDQDPEPRYTKAELIEHIRQSRLALEEAISLLTEAQLTTPGPERWSVKDHLAHMAVWELGIAELLQRRSRFAAMQIDENAFSKGMSEDEVNAEIYRRNAGLSLAEVMARFRSAHQQFLEALDRLGDDDLYLPYSAYVPSGEDQRQDPVINWIAGNTFGHFDQHREIIHRLAKEIASAA
jgi:uncharacterized protein (TIGR03083 family)